MYRRRAPERHAQQAPALAGLHIRRQLPGKMYGFFSLFARHAPGQAKSWRMLRQAPGQPYGSIRRPAPAEETPKEPCAQQARCRTGCQPAVRDAFRCSFLVSACFPLGRQDVRTRDGLLVSLALCRAQRGRSVGRCTGRWSAAGQNLIWTLRRAAGLTETVRQ